MRPHEEDQSDLILLREEVHRLGQRVEALEHRGGNTARSSAPLAAGASAVAVAPPDLGFSRAISVAGKAVLGLAGAYLLRALAESAVLPRTPVIAASVAYGFAWLILAGLGKRLSSIATATYGLTSALILTPLIWEATVRFGVLASFDTASILAGYAGLGYALARWSQPPPTFRTVVLPVGLLSAAAIAIGLAIRTGDLAPFTGALLAMALLAEVDCSRGGGSVLRVWVWIFTDVAFGLLIYIATRPGGIPEGYRAIPAGIGVALLACFFLLFTSGLAWNTLGNSRTVSVFEIVQSAVCLLLAASGIVEFTQGRALPFLGASCAVASAACYFAAFLRFAQPRGRNHYFFAFWGLALGLTACYLILPDSLLTATWSAAAFIAILTGARAALPTLCVHGDLYLIAAAVVSAPHPPSLSIWLIAVSASCCYAAFGATQPRLRVIPGALAAFSVWLLMVAFIGPASLAPAIRTLFVCLLSVALAFAGSRFARRDLLWISYAAVAAGTVKLAVEDFRQSQPAPLAISLVCFGTMLMLVPRLARERSVA